MSGVGGFERVFCAVDKSDFSVRALDTRSPSSNRTGRL